MNEIPTILLTFFITIIAVWTLSPAARKIGLVDKPGGRKDHDGEIPLMGGVAMFVALAIGITLSPSIPGNLITVFIAASLLLLVGTLDDFVFLSAYSRLLAQIGASMIIIIADDSYLQNVGALMGDHLVELGIIAIPFTVFSAVGVTNAMNMSDGMDGLAGGLTLVSLLALSCAAWIGDQPAVMSFLFILIATVSAFLTFNMRTPWRARALIFMGNGGSMFLGFLLAWLFISLSQGPRRLFPPVVALWIFALPLLDTVCIMLRRILKGRSPFAPDREHLHHVLLLAGFSVNQTVWIMLGISAFLAATGLVGFYAGIPEYVLALTFVCIASGYFWAMQRAWKLMKLIHRHLMASAPHGGI